MGTTKRMSHRAFSVPRSPNCHPREGGDPTISTNVTQDIFRSSTSVSADRGSIENNSNTLNISNINNISTYRFPNSSKRESCFKCSDIRVRQAKRKKSNERAAFQSETIDFLLRTKLTRWLLSHAENAATFASWSQYKREFLWTSLPLDFFHLGSFSSAENVTQDILCSSNSYLSIILSSSVEQSGIRGSTLNNYLSSSGVCSEDPQNIILIH